MSKFAPALLLFAPGAAAWWIGSTLPQDRDNTALLIAGAVIVLVYILILVLSTHAATDGGRDSTAITRTRREEEQGAKAVYIILQSPAEVRHYHEHSGTVRHQHTHRHLHINLPLDFGGDSGSDSGSGFDDSRYLPAASDEPRYLSRPSRVFGILRPQPRQLTVRDEEDL